MSGMASSKAGTRPEEMRGAVTRIPKVWLRAEGVTALATGVGLYL
jgi:uncharacterized protein YjeT (DUF2065 family)